MKELDPSLREFAFPDFGFRDDLNHGGNMGSIWQLLYDHVSQFPKYERLRNYIKRSQAEKMELLKKQFEKGDEDEDPTAAKKKGGAAGWAGGLVAAEATPGTTDAPPINFERFESLMNSVLKPVGEEGTEAPEVDSEQMKYD